MLYLSQISTKLTNFARFKDLNLATTGTGMKKMARRKVQKLFYLESKAHFCDEYLDVKKLKYYKMIIHEDHL